jgi:chitinase
MVITSFLAALLAGFLSAAADRQAVPSAPPFKIIGYYAEWTDARYPLSGIPGDKLTHVNYAFARIGADNRLTWKDGLFGQIASLKQKYPHLKFILSVGGWTDSGPFYEMAATEEGRRTFARSCADFLKTNSQFDGIDLDWEHPVIGGLQKTGQPRDAHNYVLLLSAVRKAIGPGALLTIAVSASPRGIEPLEYADMAPFLDWVSPMTYDFHTGGARTGFNSALYNHGDPNPRLNLHDAVQALIEKGVPRGKIAAGLAFFARGWKGVESAEPWTAGAGSLPVGGYKTIAETYLKNPGFVRHWDAVAKVPWLYNAASKEWISYDDPESIRLKGEYVAAQKLAGAMFWELSHDNGALLDALRAGLQSGR